MIETGDIEDLTADQCRQLLASAEIGRVAFSDRALPAIVPVTFAMDDDDLVIRTNRDSRLARSGADSVVSFEVDDVESALHAGWSVVVTGQAHEVTDGEEINRWHRLIQTWAPGARDFFLRIPMTLISGRRLHPRPGGSHRVSVDDSSVSSRA
jgi:nitroimidazol reductase NimA-like FMN-containing flavoprotein (pyridoxamine 5'-phosphate oxidase superfamily)